MLRKVLALGTALLLSAGLSVAAVAAPAAAGYDSDLNHPETWLTLPGESCFKIEPVAVPFVMPAPPEGREWSKLVVKAATVNDLHTTGLVAGAEFRHSEKDSISHVILCSVPSTVTIYDDASAELTITPATCTAPGAIVLGAIANATWSDLAPTAFPVVATADAGHLFPAGDGVSGDGTTKEFIGTLEDQLDPNAPPCLTIPKPKVEHRDVVQEQFICGSDVTVTTTTFTTDWAFDAVLGEWVKQAEVAGTPVVTTRPMTGLEKAEHCITFVETDPAASACGVTDPGTTLTSWIFVLLDPSVVYTITNDITKVSFVATSEYSEVPPGKYTVTAVAAPGYVLSPTAELEWTYFAQDTALCDPPTLALVTPLFSVTQPTCTTNGSYTLGAVDPGTVTWTVNGEATPAGTYPVDSARSITLVATPADPQDGLDPAWVNPKDVTFAAPSPGTCDLPTLALTGADQGGLLLLISTLLLATGGLLIAARRTTLTRG